MVNVPGVAVSERAEKLKGQPLLLYIFKKWAVTQSVV